MIKKTHVPIYIILALAVGAPSAYAQVEPYIGVGYGQYKFEFDDDTDTDFDDNQEALRIFGGLHVSDMLGLEISWYEFDEASDDTPDGGFTSDLEGASLAATIGAPLHDRFSIFAKAGWFWWEAEVETTIAGVPILSTDFEGDDLFFGLGAKIGLTDAVDLRFDYDRFELEDDIEPDLDYASVSIQVNF
ncbi:MAG: porin family protein [Cellvibrionaceae bacterium]